MYSCIINRYSLINTRTLNLDISSLIIISLKKQIFVWISTMSTFIIFLFILYILPAFNAQSACPPDQNVTYQINIIDANVTNTSCSYRVFASTPTAGAYQTEFEKETTPGYVCYNTLINLTEINGFSIRSATVCGGATSGWALPYNIMPLAKEFTLYNPDMAVHFYVQVSCNGVALSSPRRCMNNSGKFLSSKLKTGLTLMLFVLLIVFF